MRSCRIDTYYVKRDEPYTKYNDFFSLHTFGDFKYNGPNTWKGHFGPYIITIVQEHTQSDITEDDVVVEENPDFKADPDIVYAYPRRDEIAKALNDHLNKIYD